LEKGDEFLGRELGRDEKKEALFTKTEIANDFTWKERGQRPEMEHDCQSPPTQDSIGTVRISN
jgi:hypothetical protein